MQNILDMTPEERAVRMSAHRAKRERELRDNHLPDFWFLQRGKHPRIRPRYVHPLLATCAMLWRRLNGEVVYWSAERDRGDGSLRVAGISDGCGELRAVHRIPRKWASKECDFWNSRKGIRLRVFLKRD